jgi:hypothetical protein
MRPPVAPALGLLAALSFSVALLAGGPAPGAWIQPGLVAALAAAVAALAGNLVGAWASRDPERGWALAPGSAPLVLLPPVLLSYAAGVGVGVPATIAAAAAYLARRGSAHASDVAMLGALCAAGLAVAIQPAAWDESASFLAPAGAAAVALASREAWDLAVLRAAARAQARGGAVPRDESPRSLVLALTVLAAAVAVAWWLGTQRDAWRASGLGADGVRIGAALALLAAVALLATLAARKASAQK